MDEERRTRLVSVAVLVVAIAITAALAMLTKDMTNVRDEPGCAHVMLQDSSGEEYFFEDVIVEELSNGVRVIEEDGRSRIIYDVARWTCTESE